MNRVKTIINTATTLMIAGILASCSNEGDYAFNDYDADGDKQLNRNEFETAFSENSDYYEGWDGNADGNIDEDEWRDGVSTYYSAYNYDEDGEFNNWDTNADEAIDDDEFTEETFDLWDENDDNYVDTEEYEEWNFDEQYRENI